MIYMILIFKNLLRLVLWPEIRSILENVLWVLEYVYSAIVRWNVLYCLLGLIAL